MGILRTDRVSGLGGANAIKGSVFFPHDGTATTTSGVLQVQNENDALTFGTDDFTIEFWFYTNRIGVTQHLYDGRGTGAGSNAAVLIQISDSNNIRFFTTSNYRITGSTTLTANEWHHVALTRTGSTHTLYVNGSSDGTYSASNTYLGPTNGFSAIGSDDNGAGAYGLNGFISNLRIAKELIYSAAFTVPTTELVPTSNTTLLCCQSPGDVEASFGGLNVHAFAASTNSKGPVASRFTPNSPVGFSTTTDVGTQFGSTFDGVTTFDSQAYFVPPGGNTRERNRGRGLIGQGSNTTSPSNVKAISFIEIQSGGTAFDFGDSTNGSMYAMTAVSSSTRAVFAGGHTSQSSPYPTTNLLEFVTIANTSKCTDFGDLAVAAANRTGASNQTRGLIAGGYSPNTRQIDKIEIATLGNATDYGDLTDQGFYGLNQGGMVSSTTRGLYAGGSGNSAPVAVNTITFVLFSTSSNSTDFGDLTHTNAYFNVGNSNGTRGIFMGGADIDSPYAVTDQIDFVTIATAGNATDFGSLSTGRYAAMGASNSTRGVIAGGRISPAPSLPATNLMEFVNIASTGNGSAFGELIEPERSGAGCSDSHGGLS